MTTVADLVGPRVIQVLDTGYPRSGHAVRGGLVRIDGRRRTVLDVVCFQFNPDSVTRTLQTRTMTGEPGDRLETTRLTGPPHETIKLDAELDAADALAAPTSANGDVVARNGLLPVLACLERIITPPVDDLRAVEALYDAGRFEVAPATAPLLLFVWGPQQIRPVTITSMTITEEAFDQHLHPIRARVSLELKVLTTSDLSLADPGGAAYLADRARMEQRAALVTTRDTRPLGVERLP
jgi:hypothetical protein